MTFRRDIKIGRPREWYVGKRIGQSIVITKQTMRSGSHRKYLLECDECDAKKEVWTGQLGSGNWSVCEHDLD